LVIISAGSRRLRHTLWTSNAAARVIEVDGDQHRFDEHRRRDALRDQTLPRVGLQIFAGQAFLINFAAVVVLLGHAAVLAFEGVGR